MHTSPSGKIYIGITSQKPERRWDNGNGYPNNKYFDNAIKKYGWNNFAHEILYEGLDKETAEHLEIYLIAMYQANNQEYGYNINNGGNHQGKLSKETRKKISESHKGKSLSEEHRKALSMTLKNRDMSEEHCKKISDSLKGRSFSEEHRKNLSIARTGKKASEETRKKLSTIHKGRTFSEDQRKKISDAQKHKKKVICIETGIIYNSISEASRTTSISLNKIVGVCKGRNKTTNGFTWRYYSDDIDIEKIKSSEEYIKHKRKKVICEETGVIYNYVSEAAKKTGIHKESISRVVKGTQKTAGGYHWKYYLED